MRRTNIYLDEPQLASLRQLAQRRGEPVAGLVRQAVAEWLTAQGVRPVPRDEWSARFDALLTRRRRVAAGRRLEEANVEREVIAAVGETRERRAHGSTRRR